MTAPGPPRLETLADLLTRPGVARCLALLDAEGEQARLVGGAVRNVLMGLPVADIDIATTASPDEVLARAGAANVHAVPTGYAHGTITLVIEGEPHEITTLREDIATDGRRAVVRYGRDFRADALRRDFTLNALSLDAAGVVHDYAGGLDDLAARRIRFIGAADQRIREDYLRILRFFRFSAVYGRGALDPEGLAASIRQKGGLATLSRERIRQEMLKLLVAAQGPPCVAAMADAGLLGEVLHGPADAPRLARLAEAEAAHGCAPDATLRLAALALGGAADVARLREALRLSNAESTMLERLVAIGGEIRRDGAPDTVALRRFAYLYGPQALAGALLLAAADGLPAGAAVAEVGALGAPRFRLTGKDVIARGVAKGPDVGRLLACVERSWLAAGSPEAEEAQRDILARVIAQS